MEADQDQLRTLSGHFRTITGGAPRLALHAAASLIAERKILHAIATRSESGEPRSTTWELMALTSGRMLASVVATSPRPDWDNGSGAMGDELAEVRGRVVSLSEVTGCGVKEVVPIMDVGGQTPTPFEWLSRWEVTLRDGQTVSIPWPSQRDAQRKHEELAAALVAELAQD